MSVPPCVQFSQHLLDILHAYAKFTTAGGWRPAEQLPLRCMGMQTDRNYRCSWHHLYCDNKYISPFLINKRPSPQTHIRDVAMAVMQFCCFVSLVHSMDGVEWRKKRKGRKVSMGPGLFLHPIFLHYTSTSFKGMLYCFFLCVEPRFTRGVFSVSVSLSQFLRLFCIAAIQS